MSNKKLDWVTCIDIQTKADTYTFPSSAEPIPTEPCSHCKGTGYKRQIPGEYGLCQCVYCSGSGKQIKLTK